MLRIEKLRSLRREYANGEEGSFGIMAAVVMLMLVMCVGVAIDISNVHRTNAKVQALSDNMGLVASIYMRDNKVPPQNSGLGYVDGALYKVKEVASGSNVQGLSGDFVVKYNDTLKQAEVSFSGGVKTNFMSAFKRSKIDLSVNSIVKYYSVQEAATSVFLVVDNSGSMAWDDKALTPGSKIRPVGAKTRIEGLTSTVLEFSENLEKNLQSASTSTSERFLRTSLIAYNTDTITGKSKKAKWGTWKKLDITSMVAGGGTDSRGPLKKALRWANKENAIHKAENGATNPKKYVIFMTDGANNQEYICDWKKRKNTGLWRKNNGHKYEYYWSNKSPGSGWSEGDAYNCSIENRSNSDSIQICKNLKKKGVTVLTIGFALEPGEYLSNFPHSNDTQVIAKTTTDSAYSFLNSCAHSDEHFVKAKNSEELRDVFDQIGKRIAAESVRIAG